MRYGWQSSRWHGPPDRLAARRRRSLVSGCRDFDAARRSRGLTRSRRRARATGGRAAGTEVVNLRPEQRRGRKAVPLDGCRATGATGATGTATETTRRLVSGRCRRGV